MIKRLFILYRLYLGIALLILGAIITITAGIMLSWILFLLGLICIFTHFFFGTLGLAQQYMETGDLDGMDAMMNKTKYPSLLYKPLRSTYYFLKSILASTRQNLEDAEIFMKKSIEIGMPMKEFQSQAFFQLGTIYYQKSNLKLADEYIKRAIKSGIEDSETLAAAYLQLSSIAMARHDYKGTRMYHKKCKAQHPTTPEVVKQLKELDRYIPRLPG